MPSDVTINFPPGDYRGFDHKHGVVSFSDHPGIPNGAVVEVHRDRNEGEDILRVDGRDEYRISLDNGYERTEDGGAHSMLCTVIDDRPWRTIDKRQTPGGDS